MIVEELIVNPKINDLDLITEDCYKKQMNTVRTIVNLQRKGVDIKQVSLKVQLAETYVLQVFEWGEEEMGKYWREMYRMKKDYKESI
jgi:hypothetical protein